MSARKHRCRIPTATSRASWAAPISIATPATFPQPVKAPKGAPNVLLILLDDVGFGQFSVTGGGVASPALEKLAKEGLLYNRFHTTALCSPTRASLLTGRGPQSSGTGIITELATGYDGYTGIIPQETATVAEVLRQNGYNTAWIGKNHNTPIWETSPNGPFTHWPTGLGFNYFYGFNAGDLSQWEPTLVENTNPVPRSDGPQLPFVDRSGRQGDRVDSQVQGDRARQAVLRLCRARRRPIRRITPRKHGSTSSKASSTWAGTAIAR